MGRKSACELVIPYGNRNGNRYSIDVQIEAIITTARIPGFLKSPSLVVMYENTPKASPAYALKKIIHMKLIGVGNQPNLVSVPTSQ